MKNITSRLGKGPHRDPDKEKFWRRTLNEQAGSRQDVRGFCLAHGLTESSFYAWRRTIGERDRQSSPRTVKRPVFVELRPQQSVATSVEAPLEIVAGDRRLLIRSGCDRNLLREVLTALESSPSGLGE
jgi:transposase-like protein